MLGGQEVDRHKYGWQFEIGQSCRGHSSSRGGKVEPH